MSNGVVEGAVSSRRIGRSILALLAGFVVNVALSVITDFALQAAGVLPVIGRGTMNDSQCALAAAYRALFSVISSYVVARLAPYRPMEHALVGAGIGMVLATAGAAATWNRGLGPHWYPVALIAVALPSGWAGARLWLAQAR
ncbi:hypothetical protein DYQ86_10335 [Acidobacteria bacterium AB60]|nr:hypothetical protein DYQ86_10335 [Acidobacteria bacterium AB60]